MMLDYICRRGAGPGAHNRWGTDTFQHFSRLYASDQGALSGCVATTGYALHTAGSDASLVRILYPAHDLTCTCKAAGHACAGISGCAG